MARTTLARRGAAVGAVSLLSLTLGLDPAAADPFVEVSREGSKFSVDAAGVTVTTVLLALGREAGFGVEDARPDVDRPIDIAVADATLEQTLRRLLERYNHLILYRTGVPADHVEPDAIARVVLLGPRSGPSGPGRDGAQGSAPSSPLAGPGAAARAPARAAALPAPSVAEATAPAAGAPDPTAAMEAALGMDEELREQLPPGAEAIALRHAEALEAAGSSAEQTIEDPLPDELEDPLLPDPESYLPIGEGTIPR
jgi:hypothetical protein